MLRPPFFIVGSERSGTTLLRLMLDHHPAIAVPHEFDFAAEAIGPDGSALPLAQARALLRNDPSFQRSGLRLEEVATTDELLRALLRQRQGGKPQVGMTVHRGFDRLVAVWPEARFVHLLRDPRAVARSVVEMGWAGNLWAGARPWIEAEQAWDRLAARLPRDRWVELRYEDLVRDPRAELGRICGMLDLAFDEAMLGYPGDTSYAAPRPEAASSWRDRVDPQEGRWVDARLGPWLARRGYPPLGPIPGIGWPRRLALEVDDRLRRLGSRIRRYGVGVTVADFVGRKLRIAPLARRARARILEEGARRIQ